MRGRLPQTGLRSPGPALMKPASQRGSGPCRKSGRGRGAGLGTLLEHLGRVFGRVGVCWGQIYEPAFVHFAFRGDRLSQELSGSEVLSSEGGCAKAELRQLSRLTPAARPAWSERSWRGSLSVAAGLCPLPRACSSVRWDQPGQEVVAMASAQAAWAPGSLGAPEGALTSPRRLGFPRCSGKSSRT